MQTLHRALMPALFLGTACLFQLQSAQAADTPPMKAGLWEFTQGERKLDGQPMPDVSSQMAEQLKNMPPAIRQKIEAQMKANGVQMGGAGGNTAYRMCISADMLSKNMWQKNDGNCTSESMSHSGNTWRWKVKCTEPQGEGEGSSTFSGSDSFTTKMHMTMLQEGKKQTMDMSSSAKWLSTDCGGIKPLGMPAKK